MSAQNSAVVMLNDHLSANWKCNSGPVAILNMASTMHERIAYCWGLAENLDVLVGLGVNSNDVDVSSFAGLVSSALVPLLATLENCGSQTFDPSEGRFIPASGSHD